MYTSRITHFQYFSILNQTYSNKINKNSYLCYSKINVKCHSL